MPSLKLTIPHALGQEEAAKRLRGMLAKIKARHGDQVTDLKEDWNGDAVDFSFKTFGMSITGNVAVGPDAVNLDGQLPFAAMMFKGKIESTVREELEKLLA
jgi:hypothetical protein